jgi:hypothetical protein
MPKWVVVSAVALVASLVVVVAVVGHRDSSGGARPFGASLDIHVGSPTATGTASPLTANVWVATTGCTASPVRQSTPVTFAAAPSNAIACLPSQAWSATSTTAGDTVRVRAGTYTGFQSFTGDRSATTRVIGESASTVIYAPGGAQVSCISGGAGYDVSHLCLNAANLSLENFTSSTGSVHGQANGWRVTANNVTVVNGIATGSFASVYVVGNHFTWRGGYLGLFEQVMPPRIGCGTDGEPIWIEDTAAFTTIDGITLYPGVPDQTPCQGSADGFHYEDIRVQSADDVTIKNVDFWSNSTTYGDKGSGHIFASSGSATGVQRLTLINNLFRFGTGNYAMQLGGALSTGTCVDWKFYYNTYQMAPSLDCNTSSSVWVGNTGVYTGCDGTGSGNVYQKSTGPGTGCAVRGDTIVTGPDYVLNCGGGCQYTRGWQNLGISSATGKLQAGSAAIDGAETPGPSDICTGTLVGSVDFEGNTRPFGTRCDAGADEYTG